ncbi:hypothetical protein LVJ82_15445 [Vitreoscilla massiliensis]|uniref:Uncharacterized protein n=1 Tax=Vitreoscilla massiliensis TaxID=1689272 RepID=A0ABY4E3G0_9NEIS|nr:hypothetical protein [Vitreoscilla massiliensis]UOO88833.1 hypothetical protein LVJ82_15445 [Vitreoscilla massiliensis]
MNAISRTPFDFHAALGSNQYTLDQINWHPHHAALYTDALLDAEHSASDGVVLTAASFHDCPHTYTTSRLLFQKSHHTYGNVFRSELLRLSLNASLCTSLAFVCLQAAFTAQTTQVEIMRKDSGVEKLVFTCTDKSIIPAVWAYHYQPLAAQREALRAQHLSFDLFLTMADDNEFAHPERWFADRTKWLCTGTTAQLLAFASLLLNFAHPLNPKPEWALESSLGVGGVSTGSAELELFLPASIGYLLEDHTY